MIPALTRLQEQPPKTCPECMTTGLIRDHNAGEVVCPGCGLVVDTIVDRGPEWTVYEPEHVNQIRGSPSLILALKGANYTYISKSWSHQDAETDATMWRLRRAQTGDATSRERNFYHARTKAGGWKFLFQAYNLSEGEYPHIHNIEDWKSLLFNKDHKIYDEYDREHTIEDFWGLIQNKQKEGQSHVTQYGIPNEEWIDDQGYEFSLRDFS